MVTQELIEYIKNQLQKGSSKEDIKNSLVTIGWSITDVEEGLNAIPPSPPAYSSEHVSQETKAINRVSFVSWKKIVLWIFILVVVGVGGYYVAEKFLIGENGQKNTNENTQKSTATEDDKQKKENIIPETNIDLVLNCAENDLDCLIKASIECVPTRLIRIEKLNLFGVQQTNRSFIEISKNEDENKCNFFIRPEKIDIVFPPETSQEIVSLQQDMYKKMEGLEGRCIFTKNNLTNLFKQWKEDSLSNQNAEVNEFMDSIKDFAENVDCETYENGDISGVNCKQKDTGENLTNKKIWSFDDGECSGDFFKPPFLDDVKYQIESDPKHIEQNN